jgi:adenylate kinase
MTPQTAIFIGRSGCGKGTQAQLLIDHLRVVDPAREIYYLETGQSFRNFIGEGGYSGSLAKKVSDSGELQPEFLAVWAWSHLLVDRMKENEHLIIDGTPRRLHEAPVFDSAMKFYGRVKPHLVYINVSREWSRERLLGRGRGDDHSDDIEKRLNWFDTDVIPAINFFRDNSDYNFLEINGEQTVEEVSKELLSNMFHD